MSEPILAWHFTGDTLRDGSPIPPIGETLRYEGKLIICERGYHASRRLIDALQYTPGHMLHRVECGGEVFERCDKLVCSERTIVASADAEAMLRDFARWSAWQVVGNWDAPNVVRQWLATGDEQLRHAALAAAWSAARDAARDAAREAARAAAWSAAWEEAARDAACSAALAAAWSAAWFAQNAQLEAMAEQLLAGTYTKWIANESEGE